MKHYMSVDDRTAKDNNDSNDIDGRKIEDSCKQTIGEAEEQYKWNILSKSTNTSMHKVVHDTWNNQSKDCGQTDDMMILVEEINKKDIYLGYTWQGGG